MRSSIIIPTKNEKKNLILMLPKLKKILKKNKSYEILIVDDQSSDGTKEYLEKYSKKDKRVRCLERIKKKGLSSAIFDGINQSKGEFVLIMDADFQHDEAIIPAMLAALTKNDLVIGSRKKLSLKGSPRQMFSVLKSRIASFLAKKILRLEIQDPLSGFFALRKKEFRLVKKHLKPRGFQFLLEFYVKSNPKKVCEIKYSFRNRKHGKSKQKFKVIIEFLILLISLFFYKTFNSNQYQNTLRKYQHLLLLL